MKCQKKITRDCFSLFNNYKCDECDNYCQNEIFMIGNNCIHIYYPLSVCLLDEVDCYAICFNKNLANLLYSYYKLKNNKMLFWWTNKDKIDDYFDIISLMIDDDYDIHIIVI